MRTSARHPRYRVPLPLLLLYDTASTHGGVVSFHQRELLEGVGGGGGTELNHRYLRVTGLRTNKWQSNHSSKNNNMENPFISDG